MLPSTPPTVVSDIFAYKPSKPVTVYVTDEDAKKLYKTKSPWKNYNIVALNATGIENMETGKKAVGTADCYDLNGRRITGKQSGPAIMRYPDGSTRKVIVQDR